MEDQRHLHRYVKPVPTSRPRTKHALEILQQRHRFLRDEEDGGSTSKGKQKAGSSSTEEWEEQLSRSWYDKLFREYALCDLSRYKEGGVALRWRVEQEVLDHIGELTCGSLSCKYHSPSYSPHSDREDDDMTPLVPKALTPYQLNFQYEEQGTAKSALVKVVLCSRCARKLTWKKDREKAKARGEQDVGEVSDEAADEIYKRERHSQKSRHTDRDSRRDVGRRREGEAEGRSRRHGDRRSRSRSRDRDRERRDGESRRYRDRSP